MRWPEMLGADAIDMAWHTLPAGNREADKGVGEADKEAGKDKGSWEAGNGSRDVDSFEAAALHRYKLDLPAALPRYRSTYAYLHIWSNGYAAGYYAYTWTKMLARMTASDGRRKTGGLNRKNAASVTRDMILSRGNTEDYGTMFRAFRGAIRISGQWKSIKDYNPNTVFNFIYPALLTGTCAPEERMQRCPSFS